ncbi:hypothetical protein Zmor_027822 [Zophobas morio]|uniref:Uncharacterized protein n=1 Tax=Zophobas morio TaxID=2755281 RepID=A0AA38HNV1_9CUCU|nr:hypothetical protein Zmor_027822 [Zophobas morio]
MHGSPGKNPTFLTQTRHLPYQNSSGEPSGPCPVASTLDLTASPSERCCQVQVRGNSERSVSGAARNPLAPRTSVDRDALLPPPPARTRKSPPPHLKKMFL